MTGFTSLEAIASDQVKTGMPTAFLPVDVALLHPGGSVDFDLYERLGKNLVLLCRHHYPLSRKVASRLAKNSCTLFVPVKQGPMLSRHAETFLREVALSPSMPPARRARVLENSARTIMADVLANPAAEGLVSRCRALSGTIANFMLETPGATNVLASIFQKDYYTFTHCVHVCMLGVALYRHVISPNPAAVRRFSLGALLHDVGKALVDLPVLNKPGALSAEEFEHLKDHSVFGSELLERHGLADPVVEDIVLHHHEKLNGSGYPEGLAKEAVSDITRIVAIVDIYDALTTCRPYRPAMGHQQAIELMKAKMVPHELDAECFTAFEIISRKFPGQ